MLTEKQQEQLERNKKWWADRTANTQSKLTQKSVAQTSKQLQRYYSKTMSNVIGQFEKTYNKVLARIEEGKTPTPADLYKLDTYWQIQGQLKAELLKLGNKQAALMGEKFEELFTGVYEGLAIRGEAAFNTIDSNLAQQMINQIWTNTDLLQQSLNDTLLDCLIAGKKTSDLKNMLRERFGVSYRNAETIVRTEMAHIQTEAAKKRYEDYGIEQVEILADEDERRCPICKELHGKRFFVGEAVPIPAHPRCRCCVIPVV